MFKIKPPVGAVKVGRRVGRGPGSGNGKTSGRGHKGQNSRSGGGVRLGFEGGQTPLIRRLPKRGFKNDRFAKVYNEINVFQLNLFNDGDEINFETLKEKKLIKYKRLPVKILGNGELEKKLTINVAKITKSAADKVEKAGGKLLLSEKKESTEVKKEK